MISQPLIKELQTIISEDYRIKLTLAEATDIGNTLTGYFETLIEIESQSNKKNKNDHEEQNKNQKAAN